MDTVYTLRKISDGTSTSEQQQRQRSIELLRGLLANIASTEERAAAAKLLAEMEKVGEESKANKTFNIVELVTLIVEDLSIKDLTALARLNKATYDAIKKSPVARRKMETAQTFFSSPIERPHDPFVPWAHCGALKLILDSEGSFDEETGEYEVTDWLLFFDFDCNENDEVTHSEQLLDRLICKPPVYEVEARVSCCIDLETGRNMGQAHKPDLPTSIITSNTGITIRQLLEARNRLKDEHKLCTNHGDPIPADHNLEDGFVRPNVVFSGRMQLDRKDPLVAQYTKRMVEKRKSGYLRVAKEAKFAGYIRAKTEGMFATFEILQRKSTNICSAYTNKPPIPTFAEYEEDQAEQRRKESEKWASLSNTFNEKL
jgi:hypothetical protein